MTNETHQAELLARWLSKSPTGSVRPEPPAGLDADVVDAVSALRADRAPAPGPTRAPAATPRRLPGATGSDDGWLFAPIRSA